MLETVQTDSSEATSIPQTAVLCWPGYAEHTVVGSDAQIWVVCSMEGRVEKNKKFLQVCKSEWEGNMQDPL